jgi:hypothetical protein
MLNLIWGAAEEVAGKPVNASESSMRYRTRDELVELASGAGLGDVEAEQLAVDASYDSGAEFLTAMQTAAGPVGDYYARLDDERRAALRAAIEKRLPSGGPFTLRATACAVRARA